MARGYQNFKGSALGARAEGDARSLSDAADRSCRGGAAELPLCSVVVATNGLAPVLSRDDHHGSQRSQTPGYVCRQL